MKNPNSSKISIPVLTEKMDIGTKEFSEFQAILLNKSKGRTDERSITVELLALKFQMEDYIRSEDQHSKLVGDFLKSYLTTFKIKQNKFAQYIGQKPSNLNKLMKGERSLSHELALKIGTIFKNDPMLWLDVQDKNKLYELSKTKSEQMKNYSLEDLLRT